MNGIMTLITPEIAKEFLKKVNPNRQRSVSNNLVSKYAQEMENGKWYETGESIQFDEFDELCNGQHRLNAIVKSGKSQKMMVVYGVKQDAMAHIDRGRNRTMRNIFQINGWTGNMSCCGEIARLSVEMSGEKVTDSVIFENAKTHENAYKWAQSQLYMHTSLRQAAVRLSLSEMYEKNSKKAEEFCDGLKIGENLSRDNPILVLRNFLYQTNTHGGKVQREIYKKCVSAMRAYLDGKKISRVYGRSWID